MTKVLFVCLGNICRSPTAEGIFRQMAEEHGLSTQIEVDSAGTSDWHTGHPPDPRAQEEARRHGINLSALRARPVEADDFQRFDYIIAMDSSNLDELCQLCPATFRDRLHLCTSFAPELGIKDVPDPYFGGSKGFKRVFAIIEQSARGLLAHIEHEQR